MNPGVLFLLSGAILSAFTAASPEGREVGAAPGDTAEYDGRLDAPAANAHAVIRYSRDAEGGALFAITAGPIDGGARPSAPLRVLFPPAATATVVAVPLGPLPAGGVRLRIERPRPEMTTPPARSRSGAPVDPLELLGGRADKGTLGGGEQVCAYARANPQVSYATNSLGPVFSPLRGRVEDWRPDRVIVVAEEVAGGAARIESVEFRDGAPPGVPLAREAPAPRRFELSLTADDVLLARTVVREDESVTISGDFAESREWRGSPGGAKTTTADADGVTVRDENVFPAVVARVAAAIPPARIERTRPGAYALTYDRPGTLVVACALARDESLARSRLRRALATPDPLEAVTASWRSFFETAVPRFDCTDPRLAELWWFRFYLLRAATCGGGLGRFEKRVVLEGRDAYQTFCCFSAPFLARDLAWANDADWGAGSIETLAANAYEDGRLPWYTSPRTNRVPLHHASATGNSFLAAAAWDHYLAHRDIRLLETVYEPLVRNMEWWLRERRRGGGLFAVEDLLETGMDDLARGDVPLPAVDSTSYAALNAKALGAMAHALGKAADAHRFESLAKEIAAAVRETSFSEERGFYFDADAKGRRVRTVAGFYPFFAEIAEKDTVRALDALFDERAFAAPFPIPALARDEKGFDPRSYWMGPSWPAATCHALHGAAWAARTLDRSRRDAVAALFTKCVATLFTPRIDFYERYDPLSGEGLSPFRDYMHSFWIDLVVRHVIGLEPREEGLVVLDPLPIPVDAFRIDGLPYGGRKLTVSWQRPGSPRRYADRPFGYSLDVDGETVAVRESRERIEYLP